TESPPLELTGRDLTIAEVAAVARQGRRVALAAEARQRMEASRSVIERVIAAGRTVYGVTTGFGDLADVRIDPSQTADLQRNLEAKEGLALLNGTQLMAGIGALAVVDARRLAETADVIGAMSLEAMEGTGVAFAEPLIAARPHPGQAASAGHLRALLAGSEIGAAHRDSPHRVQDAYSLRCMPQVHGAVRDVIDQLERVVSVEINAATDNPLVFAATDDQPDGEVISGGNFH